MTADGSNRANAALPILSEPLGVWRLVRAMPQTWYVILMQPNFFFGGIDGDHGPMLRNALGFLAIALTIYVACQTVFEDVLVRVFDYRGATFVGYYAAEYSGYGWPVSDVAAFIVILGFFAAICAIQLFYFGGGLWLSLVWYVHFGKVAPLKAIVTAVAYTTGFVVLAFVLASVPLIALSWHTDPTSLFYAFGPFTAVNNTKYELALTYFYVRAVSFTTGIMLH